MACSWPPPLIVPPTSNTHRSTFIILHGRGSTAAKFADPLLSHVVCAEPATKNTAANEHPEQLNDAKTFRQHFPDTKFILPTARLLRARAYNRSMTHQWFDNYPLDSYPPDHKSHVQIAGLRDSVRYVHGLLGEAAKEVGAENVVLMGLSQGCAAALVSALLWHGGRLGAVVGMCGWLPLAKAIAEVTSTGEEAGNRADDVFERDGDEKSEPETAFETVVAYLREEMDFTSQASERNGAATQPLNGTPVFLGHGTEDEKIPIRNGQDSASVLQAIGVSAAWNEYEGLGHWYSAAMLRDIVDFLQTRQLGTH